MFRATLIILLGLLSWQAKAQEPLKAAILDIQIKGNNKTKDRVILRELPFVLGDTISFENIEQQFLVIKKRLLSTGLFNEVALNVNNYNTDLATLSLSIDVQENLYIYPIVILELADRNFNVWWDEMDHSLDRINYGIRLDHINLTGRSDHLKVKLQRGYTHKYELDYDFPAVNRAQTVGVRTNLFYSDQKEIPFITNDNKSDFFTAADERKVLTRFRTGLSFYHRPGLFFKQSFKLEFHRNLIDQEVASDLNPDYFLSGKEKLRYFLLEYELRYNQQIFDIYPIGGYAFQFNIKKEGLGLFGDIDVLSLSAKAQKHFSLSKRLVVSGTTKIKTNIPRRQIPFSNNTGLGYGDDVVSGYEFYVMDGQDFAYLKTEVKFFFFEKNGILKSLMPLKAFKNLNAKFFLRWNTDLGYVKEDYYLGEINRLNNLNNQAVFGFGPALDILLYNNFLFKLEYSFNERREHALFLKSNNSF